MLSTKSPNFGESKKTALWFHNLGFKVFPCTHNKAPYHTGWKESDYSNEDIHKWCEQHPKTLWALRCNQGFYIIDFDSYKDGFDKNHPLYLKCRNFKIKQTTQSGGQHFFIKGLYPNSAGKLGPYIDTRGHDGLACLYEIPKILTKVDDIEDFLSLLPTSKDVFEGQRNDKLFKDNIASLDQNDMVKHVQSIINAHESGLDINEVAKTAGSGLKKHLLNGKAKPEVLSEGFKALCKPLKFEKGRGEYAIEFIEGMLLDYDLNGLTGEMKSAKTISLLLMLSQKLKTMSGCTFGYNIHRKRL